MPGPRPSSLFVPQAETPICAGLPQLPRTGAGTVWFLEPIDRRESLSVGSGRGAYRGREEPPAGSHLPLSRDIPLSSPSSPLLTLPHAAWFLQLSDKALHAFGPHTALTCSWFSRNDWLAVHRMLALPATVLGPARHDFSRHPHPLQLGTAMCLGPRQRNMRDVATLPGGTPPWSLPFPG